MVSISCPECMVEIYIKTTNCPKCGFTLQDNIAVAPDQNEMKIHDQNEN